MSTDRSCVPSINVNKSPIRPTNLPARNIFEPASPPASPSILTIGSDDSEVEIAGDPPSIAPAIVMIDMICLPNRMKSLGSLRLNQLAWRRTGIRGIRTTQSHSRHSGIDLGGFVSLLGHGVGIGQARGPEHSCRWRDARSIEKEHRAP